MSLGIVWFDLVSAVSALGRPGRTGNNVLSLQ